MQTFADETPETPEAILKRFMARSAEQTAADKANIAHLEATNEQIRKESAARDAAYRERLAAQDKAPGDAITSLESAYISKPQDKRDPRREELERLACQMFGRGSSSEMANREALRDIRHYREIKAVAKQLGRI